MADWESMAGVVVLFLAMGAVVLVLVYTLRTGVPPTPPTPRLRATLFSILPQGGKGPIYELGAGWGGLALGLAARFPDRDVRGFELSPLPWGVSRLRLLFSGVKNITIRRTDFFKEPLGDAGMVICYLFPREMARLRDKFGAELAPGTSVLSLVFAVPGWAPEKVETAQDMYRSKVYFYRVPEVGPDGQASGRVASSSQRAVSASNTG